VLRSSPDFDPDAPCGLRRFCSARFEHPLFSGRGAFLLRWLGIPASTAAYAALLARAFPDGAASCLLLETADLPETPSCQADALHLMRALPCGPAPDREVITGEPLHGTQLQRHTHRDEGFAEGFRALTGREGLDLETSPTPLFALLRREQADQIAYLLRALSPRRRRLLVKRHGLLDEPEETNERLAEEEGISHGRMNQIDNTTLKLLRGWIRRDGSGLVLAVPSPRREVLGTFRRGLHATVARAFEREARRGWTDLPVPLPVRELLSRVQALLDRLGLPARVMAAQPSFRGFLQDGVERGEARWQDGAIGVELVRFGHVTLRHEGGERATLRLWAEVSGLPDATSLLLEGPLGELDAFAVEGDATGAVETAWRAQMELGPRHLQAAQRRRAGRSRRAWNLRRERTPETRGRRRPCARRAGS
jgi:hypothetical protein